MEVLRRIVAEVVPSLEVEAVPVDEMAAAVYLIVVVKTTMDMEEPELAQLDRRALMEVVRVAMFKVKVAMPEEVAEAINTQHKKE